LTEDLLETAYVLSLSLDLFDPNDWSENFSSEKKPRSALPLALAHLEELGVICGTERYPTLLIENFSEFAESALTDRGVVVRTLIRGRMLEAIRKKSWSIPMKPRQCWSASVENWTTTRF
jgi:hypothetical protein